MSLESERNIDDILWEAIRKGDHQAVSTLYRRHFQVLYSLAVRISRDEDLSKDCVHDLFVNVWEKRKDLPQVQYVRSYLIGAIRNSILKTLEKQQKRNRVHDYFAQPRDTVFSVENMLISQQENEEMKQRVRNALNELTDRQKELIYLQFYEGLSLKEIQEVTSLQYQSVKNLTYRALTVLRKALKKK